MGGASLLPGLSAGTAIAAFHKDRSGFPRPGSGVLASQKRCRVVFCDLFSEAKSAPLLRVFGGFLFFTDSFPPCTLSKAGFSTTAKESEFIYLNSQPLVSSTLLVCSQF